MKIGFYQFDVMHKQPKVNLQKVAAALQDQEFDLMVLPELFTIGHLFESSNDLRPYAEELKSSATIKALQKMLKGTQAYIIAGIAEKEEEAIFNTAIIVNAEGLVGKQQKVHLTRLEKSIFSPGNKFETFFVGEVNIGIITCFDGWFPEASRQLVLQGAQVLCQPANFGGTGTLDMMKVRAMENLVYVVTANRIGNEKIPGVDASFRGESQIVNPEGVVLTKATQNELLQIIEIDPALAHQKNNVMCEDFWQEWEFYHK